MPAPADAIEHAAMLLLTFLALTSMAGLFLGAAGWFTPPALIAGSLLSGVAVLTAARSGFPRLLPGIPLLALSVILVLFATLTWPPAEFILGGLDPGAYFNTGANLARTGSFSSADPLLAGLEPEARAAFVTAGNVGQQYALPGFLLSADGDRIVPQFGMLLSALVGVGFLLGGAPGGLSVAPVAGLASLALFFLLVRRAWGLGVATVAGLLLATNAVQIWQAQQTLSEELLQVLLFGGLLAGLLALRTSRPVYAVVAGLLLAMLPLVKTEGWVLALLALGAVAWSLRRHGGALGFLAAGAAAGTAASLLHYATTARLYAAAQAAGAPAYLVLGAAVIALGLALVVAARPSSRVPWRGTGGRFGAAGGAGLLIAGGLGLALWTGLLPPLGDLARALALGSFLSVWDVLVLTLGIGVWAVQRRRTSLPPDQAVVLVTLALAGLLYLGIFAHYVGAADRIPLFMWSTRRLAPAVIPLLAIGEALALRELVRLVPLSRLRVPLLAAAMVALSLARLPDLQPLLDHREFQGAREQVAALTARLPEDSILVLDPDAAGERLATPLHFLFGRAAYILWSQAGGQAESARAGIAALRKQAARDGREVWYLTAAPQPSSRLLLESGADVADRFRLMLPELVSGSQARPRVVEPFVAGMTLFRLTSVAPDVSLPVRLDVGAEDAVAYALLREGWYGREIEPGGPTYRWTGPEARVALPGGMTGDGSVLLHLGTSQRPVEAPPARTMVLCGDRELATLELDTGFPAVIVPLPAACASATDTALVLRTNAWSPAEFGGSDRRRLGARVDWIVFQTMPEVTARP